AGRRAEPSLPRGEGQSSVPIESGVDFVGTGKGEMPGMATVGREDVEPVLVDASVELFDSVPDAPTSVEQLREPVEEPRDRGGLSRVDELGDGVQLDGVSAVPDHVPTAGLGRCGPTPRTQCRSGGHPVRYLGEEPCALCRITV